MDNIGYKSMGVTYDRDPTDNSASLYSPGTGIAINGLEEYYANNSNEDRSILYINMSTLLRNFLTSDAPARYVLSMFEQEFIVLLQEVTGIMGQYCVAPKVVFYLIRYDKFITDKFLRPPSKSRQALYNAIDLLLSRWRKIIGQQDRFTVTGVEVEFYKLLHYSRWPTESIKSNLYVPNRDRQKALLFTHMPIELHLDDYVDMRLLRSHTGEVVPPSNFSDIVFGEKYIPVPFNTVTHAYLGDTKIIIPKLKPKQKKVLLETAIAEKWRTRRLSYIRANMRAMFGPVPNL